MFLNILQKVRSWIGELETGSEIDTVMRLYQLIASTPKVRHSAWVLSAGKHPEAGTDVSRSLFLHVFLARHVYSKEQLPELRRCCISGR